MPFKNFNESTNKLCCACASMLMMVLVMMMIDSHKILSWCADFHNECSRNDCSTATLQYCLNFHMKCSHCCDRQADVVCSTQRRQQHGSESVIDYDAKCHY